MEKTVGKRIRMLRKELGLKQEELADKLNFSKSSIGMYERNERKPDYETLQKIANFFGVTRSYLLGDTDEKDDVNKRYDPLTEINKLLKKYDIDQSGFFDIDKWKAMGPDEIRELESYFEFITSRAKEKNEKKRADQKDLKKDSNS